MKKVVTSIYSHVSDLGNFILGCANKSPKFHEDFKKSCEIFNEQFADKINVVIIKYNYNTGAVSFISCPTFDTLNEPIIGDAICINPRKNTTHFIKGGNKVYHHKWMFVNSHYKGFDIKASKERSKVIEAIPEIKSLKNKIGGKEFWWELLNKHGICV